MEHDLAPGERGQLPADAGRGPRSRGRSGAKALPHSIEAEEYVISGCLLDAERELPRATRGGLTAEAFYDPRHGVIFGAMLEAWGAGKPVDAAVVAEELRAAGKLEAVGGFGFLAQVSQKLPTTAQLGYWVQKVRELSLLREVIRAASKVVEDAHDYSGGIDEFCAGAEARFAALARARVGAGRASGGALPGLLQWGELVGAAPRPEPPQLVAGLIHRGSKVMLGGGSKSFKTWCLMDLGLSVATGNPWWGLRTTKSRVLYVNFELQAWSFERRTREICAAKQVPLEGDGSPAGFVSWHLRGHASDLAELIPQFLSKTMGSAAGEPPKFDFIILDPIYKCLGERDENANGEVAALLNEVEALAVRSDAAVVFGHHFSKGNQAQKDSRDRVSGAGAWTRDPDTVITLTPHEEESCFVCEFVLRDLKPRPAMVVRWEHPCMRADQTLDPAALRQPGRPVEHTVEALVGLLRDEDADSVARGLTFSKLENLAKSRKEMSKSTFARKIDEAVKSGRVRRCGHMYFVPPAGEHLEGAAA